MAKQTSGKAEVVRFVADRLKALGDPDAARQMSAYMKTEQRFFGVKQPERTPVLREMTKAFAPDNQREYRARVLELWEAGRTAERDLRYAAIFYAERFKVYHTPALLPLCRRLVEEGAWWDLVDWVTMRIVSPVVMKHRGEAAPVMEEWLGHKSLWVRRAAILCQVTHKKETDEAMLWRFCLARAEEKDFFIRKAIGWALRQYAWTNPGAVKGFLLEHGDRLSPLSVREGGKHVGVAPRAKGGGSARARG